MQHLSFIVRGSASTRVVKVWTPASSPLATSLGHTLKAFALKFGGVGARQAYDVRTQALAGTGLISHERKYKRHTGRGRWRTSNINAAERFDAVLIRSTPNSLKGFVQRTRACALGSTSCPPAAIRVDDDQIELVAGALSSMSPGIPVGQTRASGRRFVDVNFNHRGNRSGDLVFRMARTWTCRLAATDDVQISSSRNNDGHQNCKADAQAYAVNNCRRSRSGSRDGNPRVLSSSDIRAKIVVW